MPNLTPMPRRLATINVTLAVYVADGADVIQALDDVLTDLDRAASRTYARGVIRAVVMANLADAQLTTPTDPTNPTAEPMTTPKTPRGAKRAAFTPAYLAAVPSPLSAGQRLDWAPIKAQRILAARGKADVVGDPIAAANASTRAWRDYANALNAADRAHHGDSPPPDRLRLDLIAGTYNRARLGAWTAALDGGEGRRHWAAAIAEDALRRALSKLTRGAITPDLIPDLPGRCDLTDAALDVAASLETGQDPWSTLRRDLANAAEDCAREALGEMGWEGDDDDE